MNKFLVFFLIVCLVSVHAFVKRDAPAEAPKDNQLENIQKQVQDFFQDAGNKLKEAVDPDKLKDGFNQFAEQVSKALDDLKKSSSSGDAKE